MNPLSLLLLFLLIPIFVIGCTALLIFLFVKFINKNKKFKKGLENNELPIDLKEKILKKFDNYEPSTLNIKEIVKNIGLYKHIDSGFSFTLTDKKSFYMYPTLSLANATNFKNSLFKCYKITTISGLNVFNMDNISQYLIARLSSGDLELFYINQILTIKLNNSLLGTFDFHTNEIFTNEKNKIGTFTRPGNFDLVTLINGLKIEVLINDKQIAEVSPISSISQKFDSLINSAKQGGSMDVSFIKDLGINSDWEAYMVLAIGLHFYGLKISKFGKSN